MGIKKPPSGQIVQRALVHIMKDTVLKFNSKVYRQKIGTVIGVSVSVAVAEIFVHCTLERYREKGPDTVTYMRYIDDVYCDKRGRRKGGRIKNLGKKSTPIPEVHFRT